MFSILKKKDERSPSVESEKLVQMRQRYIAFCTGPFFTTDELSAHFDELLEEPIQQFGFTNEFHPRFVMASKHITFPVPWMPSRSFDIGPMLAYFERDVQIPSKCEVTFERVISAGVNANGSPQLMHPHINSTGELCIGQGKFELTEAIRYGDLLLAVRMVVSILNTYNPTTAYGLYREQTEGTSYMGN